MKKTTFIYLLGFNFFLLSCTLDDENNNFTTIENAQMKINNPLGKPSRTDLAFITQQLTNSYKANFNDSNMSLYQKIHLLDSAALYVPLFTALKPANFTLPDVTGSQLYLNNYNTVYNTLNVSVKMKGYLDLIIQTEVVDYNSILQNIEIDSLLTINEKNRLQFIITYLQDTATIIYGGPIDESWKRRNIVAAVKGFEISSANAVFNVALVGVMQ
ncbi:hypothetical protein [Paenimyroides baculatum]|uniref:Uncharacterized protein n=1 Tax=Paenimyroides baculatum TaxID=2608000 RepID=A0A5M6CKB4_9FLAO|nr:hypothetical protein [Paenimyroides baculatum]KAA5535564.1 hypothetical protein F0460_07220 [Paenimyroides baculatum]